MFVVAHTVTRKTSTAARPASRVDVPAGNRPDPRTAGKSNAKSRDIDRATRKIYKRCSRPIDLE
jgi:hypothetical protein